MSDSESNPGRLKGFKAVSLLTLLSRFVGLARDSLMASLFGTSWILDAFTLAFRVPNMFRRLFGEGAMTAAFLPEFVRMDEQHGREAASALFSGVAWKLMKLLFAVTVATELLVAAVYFVVQMSDRSSLLCELTLILMPYMMLICMAGLYAAALNGVKHFTYPALAPVVLNLIWVVGGVIAAWQVATGPGEMRTIAAFIVVGGVIQIVMLVHKAGRYHVRLTRSGPDVSENVTQVFRGLAPVLVGLSITQINGIVDSLLAWGMSSGNLDDLPALALFRVPEGTAGAMYLGQRLFQFPTGVFAIALGTVLFPRFARHAQLNDTTALNDDVHHGLQLVLVVGVPASVGLWFMAMPITDLLFRYQQFDAEAARMTAAMIAAYGVGVWAISGLLIVNRVFYASNDHITPMRQGLICVGLNLMFDFVLLPVMGGPALPLASVIATVFQLGLALDVLSRRFLVLGRQAFLPLVWRIVICTLVMNLAGLGALYGVSALENSLPTFFYRLIKVGLPVAVAVGVYALALTGAGVSLRRLLDQPVYFGRRSA